MILIPISLRLVGHKEDEELAVPVWGQSALFLFWDPFGRNGSLLDFKNSLCYNEHIKESAHIAASEKGRVL